jgi:hypothetical protein
MTAKLTHPIPDVIASLNTFQTDGRFHPFTCPSRDDGKHREFNGDLGALVATRGGWICPWCDYTQKFDSRGYELLEIIRAGTLTR